MKKIEVEGGEFMIQSKEGHYAIIPAKDRNKVMKLVREGCDDCINEYIKGLPRDVDYAKDGNLVNNPQYPNKDNETYSGGDLPEVTVTAKAPDWVKDKKK